MYLMVSSFARWDDTLDDTRRTHTRRELRRRRRRRSSRRQRLRLLRWRRWQRRGKRRRCHRGKLQPGPSGRIHIPTVLHEHFFQYVAWLIWKKLHQHGDRSLLSGTRRGIVLTQLGSRRGVVGSTGLNRRRGWNLILRLLLGLRLSNSLPLLLVLFRNRFRFRFRFCFFLGIRLQRQFVILI